MKTVVDILTSVWVTGYLFPIAGGLWLSFFTANLVMLRTARAKTIATFSNLRWEILSTRAASLEELNHKMFRLGQPILDVADELQAQGYLRTAKEYRDALLTLQNAITGYIQSLTMGCLGQPGDDKALADLVLKQLIPQANTLVINYGPKAIERLRKVPIEWLAALELPTLSILVNKLARRFRRNPCAESGPDI